MAVIGILNPGQMGASIAASAASAGNDVAWVPVGRSAQSASRAEEIGLRGLETIADLAHECELIISVCPPAAALDVAAGVAAEGFSGLYLDANAISPSTGHRVASVVSQAGATPVDGGIIGPPAWRTGTTRLYLAGDAATTVQAMFAGSILGVVALDSDYGSASALKMAYAGWTKGSAAMLMSLSAYARSAGVHDALIEEWGLSQPGVAGRAEASAAGAGPKAWRFAGEMLEIAEALRESGLPDGFHEAAAVTYGRLAGFKDSEAPALGDIIDSLLAAEQD